MFSRGYFATATISVSYTIYVPLLPILAILSLSQRYIAAGVMEATQAGPRFLHLSSSQWNPKFSTRQDLNYECENLLWVEGLAPLEIGDNDETDEDPGEESVIRKFMRGPDEPDFCSPQADKVGSICEGVTLELLQKDKPGGDGTEPLVALLLQRSVTSGEWKGRPRQYRGPLTARALYRDLKKPVS
jgi:hypothetical protein